MQELLRHSSVKDVSSIIRVGEFAESPMLQAAITNAFKDKKKKSYCTTRCWIGRFKRGGFVWTSTEDNFSSSLQIYIWHRHNHKIDNCFLHPESKQIKENDEELCTDIFSVHVRMGDTVDVGKSQGNKTYTVVEPHQQKMNFLVYTSNVKNPKFITDECCTRLGNIFIDMPDTSNGMDRGAMVNMTFRGTEFVVTAVEKDNPLKNCFDPR